MLDEALTFEALKCEELGKAFLSHYLRDIKLKEKV